MFDVYIPSSIFGVQRLGVPRFSMFDICSPSESIHVVEVLNLLRSDETRARFLVEDAGQGQLLKDIYRMLSFNVDPAMEIKENEASL